MAKSRSAAQAKHPVARKLREDLIPHLVSARHLGRRPICRAYRFYSYANDALAALAGIGIGFPVTLASQDKSFDLGRSIGLMPWWLKVVTVVSVIGYLGLKVIIVREEAAKKFTLAIECLNKFNGLFADLDERLGIANPMPKLDELHQKIVIERQKYVELGAYPFDWIGGKAPAKMIEKDVVLILDEKVEAYSERWEAPPPARL